MNSRVKSHDYEYTDLDTVANGKKSYYSKTHICEKMLIYFAIAAIVVLCCLVVGVIVIDVYVKCEMCCAGRVVNLRIPENCKKNENLWKISKLKAKIEVYKISDF